MKTNKLIGWFFALVLIILFAILISTKEPQGRLIKHFPKDTTEVPYDPDCYQCNPDSVCGWCRAVKTYSLNVNVHHYGDSVE